MLVSDNAHRRGARLSREASLLKQGDQEKLQEGEGRDLS